MEPLTFTSPERILFSESTMTGLEFESRVRKSGWAVFLPTALVVSHFCSTRTASAAQIPRHHEVVSHPPKPVSRLSCGCSIQFSSNPQTPEQVDCTGLDLTAMPPKTCFPPSVDFLDLSHNSIYDFSTASLEGLPLLSTLDMTGNMLLELPARAFTTAQQRILIRLVFRLNRLTLVQADSFGGCTALEYLDLSGNSMTSFAVLGLPGLVGLDLSDNALSTLPNAGFPGCTSLVELVLDGNRLASHLALTGSNLTFISAQNAGLSATTAAALISQAEVASKQLEKMVLGGNHLRGLEIVLNDFANLVVVDLTNCSLDSLNYTGLPAGLHELYLAGNQLQTPLKLPRLTQLVVLDLSGNALTSVPPSLPFRSLVRLDLSRNPQLQRVLAAPLQHLVSLEVLSFTACRLTAIEPGSFAAMSALSELYLSSNQLTVEGLPTGIFRPLAQLNVLQLGAAGADLGRADWGLSVATKLRYVSMANTRRTDITVAALPWEAFRLLETLDLSGNPDITTLPSAIANAQSLNSILLCGAMLQGNMTLPKSLTSLALCDGAGTSDQLGSLVQVPMLQSLDATNTTLGGAPQWPLLPDLVQLDLSAAKVTKPDASTWAGVTRLQTLTLNENPKLELGVAPFSSLHELGTLGLAQCGLTVFIAADTLEGLTSLQALDLSGNKLTCAIFDPIPSAVSLKSIVLGSNLLTAIPIISHADLESLDLSGNRIASLDAVCCTRLTHLDVSSNALTSVKVGALCTAPALEYLDLSNNLLTLLPSGTLGGCEKSQLSTLLLRGNRLGESPPDLSHPAVAANLILIDLSTNQLRHLGPRSFAGATRLDTLSLASNWLQSIHSAALENVTRLRALYLWHNFGEGELPHGLFEDNRGLTTVAAFLSGFQFLPSTQQTPLNYLTLASFVGSSPLVDVPKSSHALGNPLLQIDVTAPTELSARTSAAGYTLLFASSMAGELPNLRLPAVVAEWWATRGFRCVCDGESDCQCTACSVGERATLNGGCTPCPPGGYYQDEPAAESCKRCPRGTFVPPPGGGTMESNCVACPEGTNTSAIIGMSCPCLLGYTRLQPGNFSRCVPKPYLELFDDDRL